MRAAGGGAAVRSTDDSHFKGFESVFEAVEKGACPYGVLPIENSAAGSVAVIMLQLPRRPGSLSEVIAKFASVGVNMTKLESRPVPDSDFEFRFVFEFESSVENPSVRQLLAELSSDSEIERFTFQARTRSAEFWYTVRPTLTQGAV